MWSAHDQGIDVLYLLTTIVQAAADFQLAGGLFGSWRFATFHVNFVTFAATIHPHLSYITC